MSEKVLDHYDARHKHHIECLIDGIVKIRCMFDRDPTFTAKQEDYDLLETVWNKVISSWIETRNLRNIAVNKRIKYMPERCQYIYRKMAKAQKSLLRHEIDEMIASEIASRDAIEPMIMLINNEIVHEVDGKYKLYYMGPNWKPKEVQEDESNTTRL